MGQKENQGKCKPHDKITDKLKLRFSWSSVCGRMLRQLPNERGVSPGTSISIMLADSSQGHGASEAGVSSE